MTAGSTSTKLIELVFGTTRVQISPDVRGLEALNVEVETKLGLHVGSFSIFDDFGKVDDSIILQRAVDMAIDGPCVLEVREAPEWKKMREMDEKITMLVARCPLVDNAIMTVEERSAKRFEKLASVLQTVDRRSELRCELVGAEMQQTFEELDTKVSKSIAPLLQSVALQEMELKAKLDSLSVSLFSQELDSKVNHSIAPMLQSMALQQMDFKDKLDSLQNSPSCCTCEHLADSLQKELSQLRTYTAKVDGVEEITKDLMQELDFKSNTIQETKEQLKALQNEVHSLTDQPSMCGGDGWIMSALRQDLGKSPKHNKNGLGDAAYGQWLEGSSGSPFAYSKKSYASNGCNSLNNGGAAAVPFARFMAPRQLDRLHGSQSLPHLPPMR